MKPIACLLACLLLLTGCVRVNVHGDPNAYRDSMNPNDSLRIATYNASLYDPAAGGLIRRLETGDENAGKVAAVLQRVRPDVVLLNEFDHDSEGHAADLFQQRYLQRAQPGGGTPLHYPYRYFATVNTGVGSGLDLDRDGIVGGLVPAAEDADAIIAYANDAWGFGRHPGQYGMLILSRYPIDGARVRTFQRFPWNAMPGARRPVDPETGRPWHPDDVWSQLRLSSKSHWDVPVQTPLGTVHLLASHPTPPVFDGPEDRNGLRNADEIRLWSEYLSTEDSDWLCDDDGRCGGLAADARFVILGDLNNDPVDGDGVHEAIVELIEHARVLRHATPASEGAIHSATAQGGANLAHRGSHAHDTGEFGPGVGNLRLDYALPSVGFRLAGSGVYWPAPGAPGADIVDGSDHRLVWLDLTN